MRHLYPWARVRCLPQVQVFVSYDFDNDKTLYDFIIGRVELLDSPFEVSDHSLKEAAPERGSEIKACAAINRADKFIVMLGSATRRAPALKKEVAMAKALGKTGFQIIGYRDGSDEGIQ